MASLYKKVISGRPYWYLREMGWVDGKPKMISERYVGTAAEVEALLDAREERMLPERTRHLDFGAVAAAWGLLADLGMAAIIDQETGPGPSGLPLSPGTYLALAALNRAVDPCSKRGFADWWRTTAADRFTKIPVSALDHRRFWDAFHAVPLDALPRIEEKLALAACARFGLDTSSVALDMTNFATFIDTGNARAPIAQRGKAKQKRSDLRLVGGPGGHPRRRHPVAEPRLPRQQAGRHPVPGDDHDAGRPACRPGRRGRAGRHRDDRRLRRRTELEANFALLAGTNLHYVGSVPASDCRDLLALPASARSVVDAGRFAGLTACDTRRAVYGTGRRAILTHSPELHAHQARGFDGTTLAKAGRKLDELAATLARGKTRRARAKVEAEIGKITHDPWVRRVVTWQLAGEQPKDFRLAWDIDQAARAALEQEIFGKHVLITDHDDWPAAEVIAAYRSQSEAEFSFRQMKDPRVVSFSPMFHWTEHNIRVHTFTCVLALQIAHLLRLQAERAGLHISVRELLAQLAGIGETVLIYPAERGRPKARRMLTETSAAQDKLIQVFQLNRHAPPVRS